MTRVTAKQFIRSLTDQSYLNIFPRAARYKIHRDYGRGCNRLFHTLHDLWKRSFKFGLIQLYRHVASPQKSGSLLCIGQLIVFKAFSIANSKCRPRATLFIHQRQEQARVEAATEKNSDRDVAEQMASNW